MHFHFDKVPGDVLTDLQNAGIIHDPFFDTNFLDERHIWMGDRKELSNGTCCYTDEYRNMKEEYRIPNLEKRTRRWIYQSDFFLNQDDALLTNGRHRKMFEMTTTNILKSPRM